MSQRHSGYKRVEWDRYETPEWVTQALLPHLGNIQSVWEPAAGSGKIVRALKAAGLQVTSTDMSAGQDFLLAGERDVDAIVTNPPYSCAPAFIVHALQLMSGRRGKVAMLLRTDFDHARSRGHLFANCPAFARKVVLTTRIRWFEQSNGSPSFNHAWYLWDWQHNGKPTLEYNFQTSRRIRTSSAGKGSKEIDEQRLTRITRRLTATCLIQHAGIASPGNSTSGPTNASARTTPAGLDDRGA